MEADLSPSRQSPKLNSGMATRSAQAERAKFQLFSISLLISGHRSDFPKQAVGFVIGTRSEVQLQ